MKAALLGFGTVGVGVYEMLCAAPGLEAGSVLVRKGKDDAPFKVTELDSILSDPTVDAVVEVMGGEEPAYTYCSAALRSGKHVVTANKALIAAKGPELAALAEENGVALLFSAACGGGVPFLHNLALAAESDEILSLGGILNGTTNYMLDAMQSRAMTYAAALAEAQALGYAEADPTADVSGLDALRKLKLACAVAYGKLPEDGLCMEGIESITAEDVTDFQCRGLTCRLVCSGGQTEAGLYAYIEPVLFPGDAPECAVKKNYNLAKYTAKNAADMVFIGQGAGRYPTASAVVRDLSDAAHGKRSLLPRGCERVTADCGESVHSYYVRLPGDAADALPMKEVFSEGGVLRGVTESISVKAMHELAAKLRKEGKDIFFAAMSE